MPGYSLWLVPPPNSPVSDTLQNLISSTLPAKFPEEAASSPRLPKPQFFFRHVTLTSEIPPSFFKDKTPQDWLNSILWPSADSVSIKFEKVKSQEFFYRRCYISVDYDSVKHLAGLARARGVNDEEDAEGEKTQQWLSWWREAFGPHVSLMYGDVPISDEKLREVTEVVQEAGIQLSQEEKKGGENLSGWTGGVIWLVPSDGPISEWKPLATREL
ncbi:putative cyclic phosphodiesterase [Podospora australis]|uniref:Cyclic phosphodiesterase n=1 Tax=Podospora australis TaxID=1536484 RepID=A0AAN7AH45_9PEZI|nr:putative cyclic phosphodiesterase [Podospora australis]